MPPVPPKLGLHSLFFWEGVRGVLRGERGNTFCVPAFLVASLINGTGGVQPASLYKRIASRGNRQDTKRSATAKQMHEATGLTVLALLLALLSQRLPCELSSSMQTVWERMKRNEVQRNE